MKQLILALYSLLFFSAILNAVDQKHDIAHMPQLAQLLDSFKSYKTTNCCSHVGNLYEHSVWVANAIENWWREDSSWVKGLNPKWEKVTILAALLHDVGKAGDLNFTYKTKKFHPQAGFYYLLDKRPYFLSKKLNKYNFDELFAEIGLTQEERKVVAILSGVHWDFGGIVLRGLAQGKPKKKLFDSYLSKIKDLAVEANYHNGTVDEKLLKMAILIGAADTKGADKVVTHKNYFCLHNPDRPHSRKKFTHPYKKYAVATTGKKAREELLAYFPSYAQNGPGAVGPMTQSEAHMSIAAHRDRIRVAYDKEIAKHQVLIKSILNQEKALANEPYNVFYHAFDIEFYVLQDIYKAFYKLFFPLSDKLDSFETLRFPSDPMFNTYKSVQEFIDAEIDKNTFIDDSLNTVRAFVISANIALFGNVGINSECTFEYFVKQKSHAGAPKIQGLIEKMLEQLKAPVSYAKELSELADMLDGNGAIAQIFIPESAVNKYAYFARSWGNPTGNAFALGYLFNRDLPKQYRMPVFWDFFDAHPNIILNAKPTVKGVITRFKANPESVPNSNRLQVRLLLTNDMLLNPSSGVKIFRYTTVSQDILNAYQAKLQTLVAKIFTEFLSHNANNQITV